MLKVFVATAILFSSVSSFATPREQACSLNSSQVKSIILELKSPNAAPAEDADTNHQAVFIHLMSNLGGDFNKYLSGAESADALVAAFLKSCGK